MALRAKAILMGVGTPIAGVRRCLFFGNAIQYGEASAPITTTIDGKYPEFVEISIHNLGSSISGAAESTIFRSRTPRPSRRSWTTSSSRVRPYNTRLSAEAHGGTVAVLLGTGGTTLRSASRDVDGRYRPPHF